MKYVLTGGSQEINVTPAPLITMVTSAVMQLTFYFILCILGMKHGRVNSIETYSVLAVCLWSI